MLTICLASFRVTTSASGGSIHGRRLHLVNRGSYVKREGGCGRQLSSEQKGQVRQSPGPWQYSV